MAERTPCYQHSRLTSSVKYPIVTFPRRAVSVKGDGLCLSTAVFAWLWRGPSAYAKGALQKDLRGIKGRLALVESTASAWGDGSQGAPRRDLVQNRIGANPPEVLATLRSDAALSVLAACGVPVTILERSDGTALREGWRQFLHASVVPVAALVSAELSDKLAVDIGLNFDKMFASDLSGRARAFQSMVGGGMDVAKAAALAGLMDPS